ncbi:MAG: TonB-dependent receptor [Bacteroidota bacterium]
MTKRFNILLFFLITSSYLFGQETSNWLDSVLQIETILVKDSRLSILNTGRKENSFAVENIAASVGLDQVLSNQSLLHIKNYGPTQLSTSSLRGGSAAHTALIWNGINIDNTMLGQTDLSLVPAFLFDEVSLNYGGGGALWGSGAISGSIHLNNQLKLEQGWGVKLNQSYNTIGQNTFASQVKGSFKKTAHSFKFWRQSGDNDFRFTNILGEESRLTNAHLENIGWIQENKLQLGKKDQLELIFWSQETERGIPPTKSEQISSATQEDESFRALLQWKHFGEKNLIEWQAGRLTESLNYLDPAANIDSRSDIQTWLMQTAWTYSLFDNAKLHIGAQWRNPRVVSNNYEQEITEHNFSLRSSFQLNSLFSNAQLLLSLRKEWNAGITSPLLMALSYEHPFAKNFQLKASVSRNYRFPTFNDRFWVPGGNRNLNPELGWSQELGLIFKKKPFQLSTTIYNRNINDWIIWLPTFGYFSPTNIQEVWSRGVELSLDWEKNIRDWTFKAGFQYDYANSTNQRARFTGDASLGKQLIYVPQHKMGGTLSLQHRLFNITYRNQWTSRVYTLPDHSESIDGFMISSILLNIKPSNFLTINAQVQNLLDEDYELVVNRAMPGRNFQIGIQLSFNHKKSK